MENLKRFFIVAALTAGTLAFASCEKKNKDPLEKASDKIEDVADDVESKVDKAQR